MKTVSTVSFGSGAGKPVTLTPGCVAKFKVMEMRVETACRDSLDSDLTVCLCCWGWVRGVFLRLAIAMLDNRSDDERELR